MARSPQMDSREVFPTTSWSLLCAAQQADGARRSELIQAILKSYWKPVYAYYRAKGKRREDAEDLVQGFLNKFVMNDSVLMSAKPGRRFRSLIRVCARNFLIDEERYQKAQRRSPGNGIIAFATLEAEDGAPFEPIDADSDQAFNEVWRRELLDRAMQRLRTVCSEKHREVDLQVFLDYYLSVEDAVPTWKELAERYEFDDWQQAARKAHWIRTQLGQAIRDVVASYVEDDGEIDAEIAALLA